MTGSDYWQSLSRRASRRTALRGGVFAAAGLAAAAVGCGSSNKKSNTNSGGAAAPSAAANAASATGTQAAASNASAAAVSTPQPKSGGNFTLGLTGVFAGVDPHNSVYDGAIIVPVVYNYLIRTSLLAPDRGILPELATSYEQSADHLTTIFHLRPDAMIANNDKGVPVRPIDAEDAKESFQRVLDPKAASNGFSWMNQWVDSMEAVDKTTFKIVTKKPYAWVLNNVGNNLYSAIVPKEWLQSPDLKKWPVGSGPFVLQSLEESATGVMARNPNFWLKGLPYLDTITMKIFADRATLRTAFTSSQVDYYSPLNSDEAKELVKSRKDTVYFQQPSLGFHSFWENMRQDPWQDARIRQALVLAMNQQEFIDIILHGDGVVMGAMSYAMGDYALSADEVKKLLPTNPQGAKQLLQAAGQPNLTIKPTFATNLSSDEVNVYQRQLSQVGITLAAQPEDPGTWLAEFFNDKPNSTFHTNQEYANPDFQLQWYHTGGITGNNHWDMGFSDPQLDAQIEAAAGIFDEAQRKQAYLDLQRKIIPMYTPHFNFYAYKSDVVITSALQNYPHGIGSLIYYYYKDLWLNR